MNLEVIVNNEPYDVIWKTDKLDKRIYYGVDTQRKTIFIYNTHDEYLTNKFIYETKVQYNGMGN